MGLKRLQNCDVIVLSMSYVRVEDLKLKQGNAGIYPSRRSQTQTEKRQNLPKSKISNTNRETPESTKVHFSQ